MTKKNTSALSLLLLCCLLPFKAEAINNSSTFQCPSRIAVLANDHFSKRAGLILKKLYSEIGCSIDLIPLPGLRGIQAFNKKQVDGEALRLPVIQDYYTRPYVKSEPPLLHTLTALWMHPAQFSANRHHIGYVRGVAWQAESLRQEKLWGTDKAVAFNSIQKLYAAYERGTISMFLSDEAAVDNNIENGDLTQKPLLTKTYGTMPFHHYLGAEFKEAMDRLSSRLARDNPFAEFE